LLFALAATADDWPQWLGPQRDGVWRETGILSTFPTNGPTVRWRVPVGGGYAGPAVADGRVYVADRAVAAGAQPPASAFDRGSISGSERVQCLRETDGSVLWQHSYPCPYTVSYPAGPRVTPLVSGERVFCLGAEGHLFCLESTTGKVLWSHDFKQDFGIATPIWGFAGHPLLYQHKLICLAGGNGTTAVAFDEATGKEIWRALSAKEPGYAPPTLIQASGQPLVIIWHPEAVNALEPDTGKVRWSVPFSSRSGLSVATPRLAGDRLFVSAFYDGSLLLRLHGDTPEVLWRSKKASERDTDCLHCLISTPVIEGNHIYGVCSYGQLRCLNAETGERLWESLAPTTGGPETRWGNAFLVKHDERFFLFNETGDLIIARLTPAGYKELSRAHLLDPVNRDPGRPVVWSHPAFANRSVYARNDKELVCVSLAARRDEAR
jgi:outer membrane protein assembly factor BamB